MSDATQDDNSLPEHLSPQNLQILEQVVWKLIFVGHRIWKWLRVIASLFLLSAAYESLILFEE